MSDVSRTRSSWRTWGPAAALAAATLVYLVAFEPLLDGHVHPVGSDYAYFLPRLLAENFWFRLNGWSSIPWFTPAFCGGMPDWANPQSMPYSLPEWLVWFVDPMTSVRVTFAVGAIAGAAGMWLVLRDGLRTSPSAALLGSVLFLFNGFFVARITVGHFAFHTFMWAPWVAWFLIRPGQSLRQVLLDGTLAGCVIAMMINGGMVVVLPPLALAWVAIGLLHGARSGSLYGFAWRLTGAVAVGAALSASKLAAMGALATHFARDYYPLSGYTSVASLVSAAAHGLFLRPLAVDASGYGGGPVRLAAHEGDYGVSPVPVVVLVAALFFSRRRMTKSRHLAIWVALATLCLLPLALNFHSPGWSAFLRHLPIIRSSSTLVRWFVFYIPVLAVAGALALDRLPQRELIALLGVVAAIGWSLTLDRGPYLSKSYRPSAVDHAWSAMKAGEPIPTIQQMDVELIGGQPPPAIIGADDDVAGGACQVFCYEPLFGYFRERLPWQPLHSGPPLDATGDLLNIKDPSCELFPLENGCRPGDQFHVGRKVDAEAFSSWAPFPFARSLLQRVADLVNVAAVILTIGGLLAAALSFLRAQRAARAVPEPRHSR